MGNFVIKEFVAVFGSKRSLFVSVGLYVIGSVFFINATSFLGLFTGAIILGVNDQLIYVMLKVIMNELFLDQFTHYLPICYTGYAFSPLIWPTILSHIVNPLNESPSVLFLEKEKPVYYFSKTLVENLDYFLKLQMLVHLIMLLSMSVFLRKSNKHQSKFSVLLTHIRGGEYRQASLVYRESKMHAEKTIDKALRQSLKNLPKSQSFARLKRTIRISFTKQLSNELQTSLMNKVSIQLQENAPKNQSGLIISDPDHLSSSAEYELKPATHLADFDSAFKHFKSGKIVYVNEESKEKIECPPNELTTRLQKVEAYETNKIAYESYIRSELFTRLFFSLFFIAAVRSTTGRFFFSSFKIMGLYFFNDDKLINTLGSLAYLGYIASSISFGHIFDHLGLRGSYSLLLGSLAIMSLGYALFDSSIVAYFLLSCSQRVS
jgi:MFS family permease